MKTDRKIIAMAVICALLIAAFASVVPAHAERTKKKSSPARFALLLFSAVDRLHI